VTEFYRDFQSHFYSHVSHDGKSQYVFVRSGAHAENYGTLKTCSVSKGEAYMLQQAVDDFTAKLYEDCSLGCRHDPTWEHMVLLANDAKHAQEIAESLKQKGYDVIDDIDVLWPNVT
jgi:hypothetical protein